MIVPRSLFRCGFAIESIAQAIDDWPIPQLDDQIGARECSARIADTLYFAKFQEYSIKNSALIAFLSGGVK